MHTTAGHVAVTPSILYFGTPVALLTTCNPDGSPNLAPISSAWALGYSVMLGLGTASQTFANLQRQGEVVINLPDDSLWSAVERLAPLTGMDPVPAHKLANRFRHEPDKFGAAGLTPQPAESVAPPRVQECPLQLEGRVVAIHPLGGQDSGAAAVEVQVLQVHADPRLVLDDRHIDPAAWHPLLYNFRHYYGLAPTALGKTFRAER